MIRRTILVIVTAAMLSGCGMFTANPSFQLVSACEVIDPDPYLAYVTSNLDVEPDVSANRDEQSSCLYNIGDNGLIIDATIWVVPDDIDAEARFAMERDRLIDDDRWEPGAISGDHVWTEEFAVSTGGGTTSTAHVIALDANLVTSMYVQVAFDHEGIKRITGPTLLTLVSTSVNGISEAAAIE